MGKKAEQTQALLIDMQEKLLPVISGREELTERTAVLLRGLALLEVPVTVTTQYRKGLGETVAPLLSLVKDRTQWDKVTFSCMQDEAIGARVADLTRPQVLICGVESHICVLQTVLDLLEAGYQPVVVADCVGSRVPYDREIALRRMEQAGAVLTTAESVLYELTERAGSEVFKQISALTRVR